MSEIALWVSVVGGVLGAIVASLSLYQRLFRRRLLPSLYFISDEGGSYFEVTVQNRLGERTTISHAEIQFRPSNGIVFAIALADPKIIESGSELSVTTDLKYERAIIEATSDSRSEAKQLWAELGKAKSARVQVHHTYGVVDSKWIELGKSWIKGYS